MTAAGSVFVLMPFEAGFDDVYEELIKKPLEAIGFVVTRADSLFNQQQILKDVVKGIADATLVVADVTGLNENVLYELGLAHALGKRTVMITQHLEELPFDLRPYRANEYSILFNRAHELRELLSRIGKAVLAGEADFSNPVQDFAPHALRSHTQVSSTHAVAAPETDDSNGSSDEEAPGVLELLVGLERGGHRASEAAAEIGRLTEEIGNRFHEHTARLNRASERLGDRAAGAQLAIARDVAGDLDGFSDAVEPLCEELRASLGEMVAGADAIAREGVIHTEEDAAAVDEMIDTLRTTENQMDSGRAGILSFAQAMLDLPHVDRRLSRAARRAAGVVTRTAEEIETAESEFARARGLLEERLIAFRIQQDQGPG